jgi:hypothetical protein
MAEASRPQLAELPAIRAGDTFWHTLWRVIMTPRATRARLPIR